MNIETRQMAKKRNKTLVLVTGLSILIQSQGLLADLKSDSDLIFNWAEVKFPSVLSSHQPTQTIENQWYFRNYAATDFYTGINIKDNGVYYITGDTLRKGGAPTSFGSVSEALKIATENACDASKLPAGYTRTQEGNTITIKTNGCIPEPLEEPDYCPQTAKVGGISLKTSINLTETKDGKSDATDIVSCDINVADTASPSILLDLCYTDRDIPTNSKITKGKMVIEKVDDCLKTDASFVHDLTNDRIWVRKDKDSPLEEYQYKALISRKKL